MGLIKHFLVFPHFNRSYCSLPGESLRSSRLVFGGFFLFVVVFFCNKLSPGVMYKIDYSVLLIIQQ